LQTPWTEYANKVEVLFGKDPEIEIEYDDLGKKLTLRVDSPEKAEALETILENEVTFGNITLTVKIVPSNEVDRKMIDVFEKAFKGNPVVSYIKSEEGMPFDAGYVVFKPEVVQYFNDNLGDINGLKSTLYAEVAKDVFPEHDGVFFCTDIVEKR
jgi:hypothetical protein